MSGDLGSTWLDRLVHDLRGPLGPLQTAVYLLRRDDLDPQKRVELMEILDRQTRRLGRMLDELDEWTRTPRQPSPGPGERCDLALILDYALASAGIAGTPVESGSALIEVQGDQQRLTQLLRSLLGFATGDGGTPRIILSRAARGAQVDVCLAGPAPGSEILSTLFEHPQAAPYDEGLGLRMMLARVIARAHGGELAALVEDGSLVLRLELPLASAA
ncbi:MAG: histidine kinase dimerization/phospho-acceptor domain-containing protein [Luteimonas sp.]